MKLLLLLSAYLFTFTGCSGEKTAKRNEPEFNPSQEQRRNCGYEHSTIRGALCLPLTDYFVISHKSLPQKLKILINESGDKYERFNECRSQGSIKVERNLDSGKIFFEAVRGDFYKGIDLEIVDMGEKCDNDAIFFSGAILPKVDVIPNDRDRATIDLGN